MQNPPFNPFEFLTTPWGKLPLGGGLSGTSGFSPADLQELDKRISELKAVEQWLSFNHNLLKTTIQGLEVQRGTLAAIQSFTDSMSKPTPGGKPLTQPRRGLRLSRHHRARGRPERRLVGFYSATVWADDAGRTGQRRFDG